MAFTNFVIAFVLLAFSEALVIQTPTANKQFTVKEDVTKWNIIVSPTIQGANGNTFFTYTIAPQNGKINIFPSNGTLYYGNNPGFDYEKASERLYNIVLTAYDRTSSTTVAITVAIQNAAEPPVILNLPRSTTVLEDEVARKPAAEDIFTLMAHDPEGSALTYTIESIYPTSIQFRTKSGNSAIVQALHPFDFETVPYYDLTISVTDATSIKSTKKVLRIEVTDRNEEPFFGDSAGGDKPEGTLMVKEELAIGTKLKVDHKFGSVIQAHDVDAEDNNKLSYFLDGYHQDFFEVKAEANVANIYVRRRIDYEQAYVRKNPFELRVYARDSLGRPSTTFYKLTVNIENVNDNLPFCNPSKYSATISENTAVGTTVLSVSCFDADGPLERFDITGDANATKFFEIDPATGALKVKDTPDLEMTQIIAFKGHAIQGTPNPTSASVSIQVTITGKNDNNPEFKDGFYNFQTPCDFFPVHYASNIIGKVTAKDRDVSTSVVTYAWVGNDPVGTLTLSKLDGRIRLAKELKESSQCNLKWFYYVRATDNEENPTFSAHIPTRIDTFRAQPHLVNFHVDSPVPYFTDDRLDRFLEAMSSSCNGCVGKLFRFFGRRGKEATATTLTVYALKDATTESFKNIKQEKQYVKVEELLEIFGDKKATTGLRIYDEFAITGVEKTIPDAPFHRTPGGITIIVFCCLAGVAFIIAASVKGGMVAKEKRRQKPSDKEKIKEAHEEEEFSNHNPRK